MMLYKTFNFFKHEKRVKTMDRTKNQLNFNKNVQQIIRNQPSLDILAILWK